VASIRMFDQITSYLLGRAKTDAPHSSNVIQTNILVKKMLIENSEKVHVVIRRTFEADLRRHFIGEIKVAIGSIARIEGYFMLFDKSKNSFVKKPSKRATIMDLSSSSYWVNIIPKDVRLEDLNYKYDSGSRLTLTDGKSFELDINEFGALR